MSLHGVCPIALTPFTAEGDLDEESIDSLSEFYLGSGVHGITILGIMGEAHKLSDAERRAVTQRYVSAVGGRVPVVVGCSAVATKVVAERAREAEEAGGRHPQGDPQAPRRHLLLPRPLPRSQPRRGDAAGARRPGGSARPCGLTVVCNLLEHLRHNYRHLPVLAFARLSRPA